MKKGKIFLAMSTLLLVLTGCKNEIIIFGTTTPSDDETEMGYIAMEGISVAEVAEEMSSGPTSRAAMTRAVEAPNDYKVSILNLKTEEAQTYTYEQLKSTNGGHIELLPGTYTISAESPDYADYIATGKAADWEVPVYAGDVTKLVQSRKVTVVDDLICKLANIKTTVSFSPDMARLFMSDEEAEEQDKTKLSVTLSIDDASLTFDRTAANEGKAGYFKTEAGQLVTIKIVLKGEYNTAAADQDPQYTTINWTNELTDCRNGQWRKISIGVADADSGNAQFDIRVENWVYDELVDVDIMQTYSFTEETIPDDEVSDENAPVVELPGGNIDNGYNINGSMYDSVLNKWSSNLRINFCPQEGSEVAEIRMSFESDNAAFIEAFTAAGLDSSNVPLWPASSAANGYAVMTPSTDGTIIATVRDEGMSALYRYEGTHTVKFTVKDNLGRTSYTTLDIRVSADGPTVEAGPTIKWTSIDKSKTYDFNTRYPHDEVEIVIEVTTESAFKEFTVEIISDKVLPPDDLIQVGLNPHLDLINPGDYESKLNDLGFPTGENVSSKKTVTFDITGFMTMLTVLNTEGDCDFKLTVSDDAGTVSRTIQLHVSTK